MNNLQVKKLIMSSNVGALKGLQQGNGINFFGGHEYIDMKVLNDFLEMPLEDMPKFINSESLILKALVSFRLRKRV